MSEAFESVSCVDCVDWFGCCHSGQRERKLRHNHIASSEACEDFRPKKSKLETLAI